MMLNTRPATNRSIATTPSHNKTAPLKVTTKNTSSIIPKVKSYDEHKGSRPTGSNMKESGSSAVDAKSVIRKPVKGLGEWLRDVSRIQKQINVLSDKTLRNPRDLYISMQLKHTVIEAESLYRSLEAKYPKHPLLIALDNAIDTGFKVFQQSDSFILSPISEHPDPE